MYGPPSTLAATGIGLSMMGVASIGLTLLFAGLALIVMVRILNARRRRGQTV